MTKKNFYVSNGEISRPPYIQGITPDVDLNGICWNNVVGMFYYVDPEVFSPIIPPLQVPTQGVIPGKFGVGP